MRIFCINGVPRAGKDEFVKCCQGLLGARCLNISTVDFVKSIAFECGWDGTKTPENRAFLSDLKDLLTKWNDVPYKKVAEKILQHSKICRESTREEPVIFVHVREPEEIQKIVDRLGAQSIIIRRTAVENNAQSNHADANVFNYKYDYEIRNDKSLSDLYLEAKTFLESLKEI